MARSKTAFPCSGSTGRALLAGNLDADGIPDLLVVGRSDDRIHSLHGLGNFEYGSTAQLTIPRPQRLAFGPSSFATSLGAAPANAPNGSSPSRSAGTAGATPGLRALAPPSHLIAVAGESKGLGLHAVLRTASGLEISSLARDLGPSTSKTCSCRT
jgi:hypothetical protein